MPCRCPTLGLCSRVKHYYVFGGSAMPDKDLRVGKVWLRLSVIGSGTPQSLNESIGVLSSMKV